MSGSGSIEPVVIVATPASGGQVSGTTIADLLDGMPNRVSDDKIPGIIQAVNKAIALITKRLFILESDFTKDTMRIFAFAQVDYQANTISFVSGGDSGSGMIVDTASGLLEAGFKAGMPITTDNAVNPGPFWIEAVEAGIITLRAADRISAQAAGQAVTITSGADLALLPVNFWGMTERPQIVGQRFPLSPIPNQATKLHYAGRTGPVQHYELAGDKMRLYPGTGTDIIIIGDYWKKPARLTDMDDILPFNDLFNDAIEEYLIGVLGGGPMAAMTAVKAMMLDSVDLIVKKREIKAPARADGGIDWGGMHE